jgi:hypothetical protein
VSQVKEMGVGRKLVRCWTEVQVDDVHKGLEEATHKNLGSGSHVRQTTRPMKADLLYEISLPFTYIT